MPFTLAFNRLSFYSSPVSSQVYSRPSSPTRVNLHGLAPVTSSSVKFSLASRSGTPNRSATVSSREKVVIYTLFQMIELYCWNSFFSPEQFFSFCLVTRFFSSLNDYIRYDIMAYIC
ncbi:hypothetical protein HanXRQr2_Chr04g0185781 [Helianthus annuus]|uniref:Uncharacterized protein n=1 Tax=Helianthus annuus TaxID=4232 RepID=A0A9K3JBG9_HELAN|nr:hypothetical protein HanXRQr2_Chr04g0185781 [Helianthus annuus]KAJ0590674.1 hypothetical protein HanIR_Chr04g0200111 [Helianthus annuus]KAJ0932936.1 hypothetical protein HanPSC8_Chr04g0179361 [Helianthus annuus]